jgi:hypothetical protein
MSDVASVSRPYPSPVPTELARADELIEFAPRGGAYALSTGEAPVDRSSV